MNKKFFAALASATMAFTASGSIAVFADDFVEENTPSIDAGDLKPLPTKVKFDEETFGGLVKAGAVVFKKADGTATVTLTKDNEYETSKEFKDVASIELQAGFEGEVKGLEYFTALTKFDDSKVTVTPNVKQGVTNKALDFSANTKLTTLNITKAADLEELTLPKADEDEEFHLATLSVTGAELPSLDLTKQEALNSLTLTNTQTTSLDLTESDTFTTLNLNSTKLNALDLSKQEKLSSVTVIGNRKLEEIALHNGKKSAYKKYSLNLSNNALETVNLDYIEATTLNLSGNHIGALDLSNTKVAEASLTLDKQTFYVSENAANVNLTEAFSNLEVWNVTPEGDAKFDKKTGVLTLEESGATKYKYAVAFNNNGAESAKEMKVELAPANPMNRLYNPNSGEHFYTADVKEKEALVALGWQDEGYGWVAAKTPSNDTEKAAKAVYRLYNPNAGDHHYTMDVTEVKTLVAYGWKDEGTGWYSTVAKGANKGTNDIEVYRQYNPYANGAGSHNYTTDKAENDYLVSLGWTPEGTAWYAYR